MVSPWMAHGNVCDAVETLRKWGHTVPYEAWVSSQFFEPHQKMQLSSSQLLQLAKGLGYLHEENVVHGDVRGVRSSYKLIVYRLFL